MLSLLWTDDKVAEKRRTKRFDSGWNTYCTLFLWALLSVL